MRLEAGIGERLKKAQIGLKDTFAVIDMAFEYQPREFGDLFPYEVFEGLDELIGMTVQGTRIERFNPQQGRRPFHTFEIHMEGGEILGYLNMIYLRKPLPCYYLVYVEVLPPLRGRGLGNKILKAFREFAEGEGAVGLLDNIIPSEEPTYDIYTKLGWKGIEDLIGDSIVNGDGNYMIFIPSSVRLPDLKDKLLKLLFKVKKKRSVIDMHDNESMVKRTIDEFRAVYDVLEKLFEVELSTGIVTPFMRFMYTKFITKVLGFQRRITTLLGFTGGESLEQISISDRIKDLPVQSYSLWDSKEGQIRMWGEERIIQNLPEGLKKEPTLLIEGLPLYRRPYLISWMKKGGGNTSLNLKISDLLELGFDPTKLREFRHEGVDYIFERVSPGFLPSIEKKMRFLSEVPESGLEKRFHNTTLQINPPLAIIQDRGNLYILRRKVDGIHSEEALDQLRTSLALKTMNREVGIDRTIVVTINEINKELMKVFGSGHRKEIEDLAFFVPWDLERNIPKVTVDVKGISLDVVWLA
jgi:GNAT superfamily N-acetyltransferase